MLTLGIDLSLNRSAFVLLDADGKYKKHWILKNRQGYRGSKRLSVILRFVSFLTKICGEKIDAIGIENYSYGSRGGRAFDIGEAGGVVRLVLYSWRKRTGREYFVFPPKTIKKFASGNGNANKALMIEAVKNKWNFDAKDDDDLADAFAVAKMTRSFKGYLDGQKCSEEEMEVISKISMKDTIHGKR